MSNDCDIEVAVEGQTTLDVTVDDQEISVTKRTETQQARVDINTDQHLTTEIRGGVRNVNVPVVEGQVLVDGGLFLGYPLFIQDDQPTATSPYLWIETDEGEVCTFWVNTPD